MQNNKPSANGEIPAKRDASASKKRIKIIAIVVLAALLLLGALAAAIPALTDLILSRNNGNDVSFNKWLFFEPDYGKDILADEVYLSYNRRVYYDRFGDVTAVPSPDPLDSSDSAAFFYRYFDCLVKGDYRSYSSFFTEEFIKKSPELIPESFTMQAVYDINVKLFNSSAKETSYGEVRSEIYEVSYRIFENNGTFRTDILPDETRTLVFEIYVMGEEVKINAIGYRNTADK